MNKANKNKLIALTALTFQILVVILINEFAATWICIIIGSEYMDMVQDITVGISLLLLLPIIIVRYKNRLDNIDNTA